MLDREPERVLRRQRGVGAGHATLQQVALERIADAGDQRRLTGQHERQQAQRSIREIR